jgi:hypothetical protein
MFSNLLVFRMWQHSKGPKATEPGNSNRIFGVAKLLLAADRVTGSFEEAHARLSSHGPPDFTRLCLV